jgi:hypothetical protein
VTAPDPARYLIFEFRAWVVAIIDAGVGPRMSDSTLQEIAANLDGRTTADGFLVLTARNPLELLGPDSGAVPELTVGTDVGTEVGNGVELRLQPCSAPIRDVSGSADHRLVTLCQPEWGLDVAIYGTESFVQGLDGRLAVRRLP